MEFWDIICYVFTTVLVIQAVRLAMADADLNLLFWQYFGKKPDSLKGKVVWITGASSGIGEYLAYDLAQAGCQLVLSARRKEELERVKANCSSEDVLVKELDLLNCDSHADIVQSVLDHYGHIDILVNNGGRSQRALIEETDMAVDKALLDLNVLGTLSLTKAVLPHFVQRKAGHVVVTSSVAGKIGAPLSASYSASKFALQGWFETMRVEYAQYNVAVTLVCPGPVFSNVATEAFTGDVNKKHAETQPANANCMMTERCSELMATAIANRCGEVWISTHPVLLFTYLAQYTPALFRTLAVKVGLSNIKKIRGQK